jgi:hypothetical protein
VLLASPYHFSLILIGLVSIAVPPALLICSTPRMLFFWVLRTKFLVRFGSVKRTFPIAPGGTFVTLAPNGISLGPLVSASPAVRKALLGTKISIGLPQFPAICARLHVTGTRHRAALLQLNRGRAGSASKGGGGGGGPNVTSARISPKPVPKSKPVSNPGVAGSSMSMAAALRTP